MAIRDPLAVIPALWGVGLPLVSLPPLQFCDSMFEPIGVIAGLWSLCKMTLPGSCYQMQMFHLRLSTDRQPVALQMFLGSNSLCPSQHGQQSKMVAVVGQ